MEKLVSVNMGVYDEDIAWLEESIASICQQTYRNFEFIIVYDHPTNKEILAFLQGKAKEDERIRLLVNEQNKGMRYSLNRALEASSGEYVLKIDADDVAEADRLEKQLAYIEKEHLDIVATHMRIIDETGAFTGEGSEGLPESPEEVKKMLPLANFIAHPSVFYRREKVLSLGGYREFPMSIDYDLWLRALSAGLSIGIMKEPLLRYRVRKGSISHKDQWKLFLVIAYEQKLYDLRQKGLKDEHSKEALAAYLQAEGYEDGRKKRKFYEAKDAYEAFFLEKSSIKALRHLPRILLSSSVYRGYLWRFWRFKRMKKKLSS